MFEKAYDEFLLQVFNHVGRDEETDKKLARNVVAGYYQHIFITTLAERLAGVLCGKVGDKNDKE